MRGLVLAAVLLVLPTGSAAQALAEGVVEVDDGTVRLSFATRPGVEICDRGIRMGRNHHVGWSERGGEGWDTGCRPGPALVELEVRAGRVRNVEVLHDAHEGSPPARDLGRVAPDEAVDFLASVVRGGEGEAPEDAVLPMVLADVDRVWERLLGLARDPEVVAGARKQALFWLGQEAAEVATAGLAEVAADALEEQEVRDAAVFALSQRPQGEAVPALMELARTAEGAETRRNALFWLAQSGAPEVVDFFAEILRGGGEG